MDKKRSASSASAENDDEFVDCSSGDSISADFKGQFNVKMLNQHLTLCLRVNNNTTTIKADSSITVTDGGSNGAGDDDSGEDNFQSFDEEVQYEILMAEYISIFKQLYKFFCMLGTVFGFVGSDVKAKVEILQEYLDGPNKHNYETVEKMLHFEKTSGIIEVNKLSSGSRTFLRLHRALVFVSQFLEKTMTIKDDDGTAHVCKEAYSQTLAKYHPWLIQKGATLAMYALPSKKEFFKRVCADHIEAHEIDQHLAEAIRNTQRIYDQCQVAYEKFGFLNLP